MGLDVRIFASELAVLIDEMAAHPMEETGGDLIGLWSHGDTPTIFLATRPGANAIHESMYFQQDAVAHRATERLAWIQHGMQCVGMWHSHHRLELHDLSRGDLARTMRYARRYRRQRFVDVLGYVISDNWHVKPYVYRDAAVGRTARTRLVVLPGESPLRAALRDASPPELTTSLVPAPPGPVRPWTATIGEPLSPHAAETEGAMDEVIPTGPPPDPGAGPWRAIDAVEKLVDDQVPERIRETMELDLVDGGLVLRLNSGNRRLVFGLSFDGTLGVHGWEIVGPRPITAAGGGEPHMRMADAVRQLMEG